MDETFVAPVRNRSTGKQAYRFVDCDEPLYRQPTVTAAFQATDVALRRSKHTRELLLRNSMRASKQAKPNAQTGSELPAFRLAPR